MSSNGHSNTLDFYTGSHGLASTSLAPAPPQAPTQAACTVWNHEEYRSLRDKYEKTLEQLGEANVKLASLMAHPPNATASSSRSHHRESHRDLNNASSKGNAIPGGYTTNLAAPPDPAQLAHYRAEIGDYVRPIYNPDHLFFAGVKNYSRDEAKTTGLQNRLPDERGQLPDDNDWKAICKDRKAVAEALLDKDRTWTAQRDEIIDVCVTWMEKRHPRLALCDTSKWKAVNVLKARFEEARKPVTAGTRVRKREGSDEMLDPDLLNHDGGMGKKKRKKGDIEV